MKNYIGIVILISLIVVNGCHHQHTEKYDAYSLNPNFHDSIIVANEKPKIVKPAIDSNRYFLVSYRYTPLDESGERYGRIVEVIKGGFVNEADLIKRIKQFWHITGYIKGSKGIPVISTIFEFKDSTDYQNFVK
jgi:hypothetical protein